MSKCGVVKSIEVVNADINDYDSIFAVEHRLVGEETKNTLMLALANSNYHFFVAKLNNEVIGYIEFIVSVDSADLVSIAVLEDYQRLGVGKCLFNVAVKKLSQFCDLNQVLLEVRKSNDNAIKFYEKLGFINIGVRKSYYKTKDNRGEDALIYRLTL